MNAKILPKAPTNPPHLMALYREQASAIGKLLAPPFEQDRRSRAGFNVNLSLKLQLDAILPTVEALQPELAVLSVALHAAAPELVDAVLEIHDASAYIAFEKDLPLAKVIRSANYELLRVLLDHGLSLRHHEQRMMTQSLRRRDCDYYDFVRGKARVQAPILDLVDLPSALLEPAPWLVPHLLPDLEEKLRTHPERFMDELHIKARDPVRSGSLRYLALMIRSGIRLNEDRRLLNAYAKEPQILEVLNLTATRHGQLKLAALEPDLETLLSRPKSASFYGMTFSGLTAQ